MLALAIQGCGFRMNIAAVPVVAQNSTAIIAEFVQQHDELIGSALNEAPTESSQGSSIALSSDGNTLVEGGTSDNEEIGGVWVFTRSGGVWTQQGSELIGSGATGTSQQGYSVAISNDGNTLIEGGPQDNGGIGGVWVFTRSGGVWTQQGSELIGTGATGLAFQGYSVAISSDGNTLIESGPQDNGGIGGVWVFTRSGGVWTQQGSELIGTGATGLANQGYSVGLSGDGNTLVEGGVDDNTGIGGVWVFTRSGGVWTQQGSELIGTGATGAAGQGNSVALSGDGNTLVEGGSSDNAGIGGVWIFTRSAGVWTQQGAELIGTGATGPAVQGYSVAISNDGNTLVEGGTSDNGGIGGVWVFTRSAGVWTQQGSELIGTGASERTHQGQNVAISADGNTLAEGGYWFLLGSQGVWTFTLSGGVWTQQGSKLLGTVDRLIGASEGTSIALSSDGNTLVEGGPGYNESVGGVWVFTRSGGVWTQQGPKLVGAGATGSASQGISVALSSDGNTLVEGGNNDNGSIGGVWVFTRSGGVWTQQGSELIGSGATGSSQQGYSVAISSDGNTLVEGGNIDNGSIGGVWVFTRSGGVWTQQGSELIGTGATGTSAQGYSVALSSDGNTLVEGGVDDNGGIGGVWVFTRSGGIWTQQGSELIGTGATGLSYQGQSVALSGDGNTLVEGGNGDNGGIGGVWVFTQ